MRIESKEEFNAKFKKGDIVVTEWYCNNRCIVKVEKCVSDETFIGTGINANNILRVHESFGYKGNDICLATNAEISLLKNALGTKGIEDITEVEALRIVLKALKEEDNFSIYDVIYSIIDRCTKDELIAIIKYCSDRL